MKELSIEEKAERYDEALEKAKNYHSPETVCNIRIAMENLFPELKEGGDEDERIRKELINDLEDILGTAYGIDKKTHGYSIEKLKEQIEWLKSLKDRVQPQPKQEWSKEDERLYNDLLDTYYDNDEDYPEETYQLMLKRVLDWMTKRAKSLRPHATWKPSDEQMEGLLWVLENCAEREGASKMLSLANSIYDKLKKLK